MPCFTCITCGAQYASSDQPPSSCIICSDDRQYVNPAGQAWATRAQLLEWGHKNEAAEVEPGAWRSALCACPACNAHTVHLSHLALHNS